MASNPLTQLVFDLFIVSAVLIMAYTMNFYYLAVVSSRRSAAERRESAAEPSVTVHLPIYNEKYVAARLIDAVCRLDYPRERLRVMVLDDSDDDTTGLVASTVEKWRESGTRIEHVRRGTRSGYKAGSLRHAMKTTDSDLVAIFDADFVPPPWFLRRAIPQFARPEIGFVQCRWGHLNEGYSSITRVQAISLDIHFLVEQRAKSDSGLFMNFNGTAGVWRRECIVDAGGWHDATLVEDLDLSYRAQMRGWRCIFLPDVVVNAELPAQMNAVKRQQFRWAKGSIQCAVKLLTGILARRGIPLETKVQAFVQLTRHIVFPLTLVQFLALPILLAANVNLYAIGLPAITIAAYLALGPLAYVLVVQSMYGESWAKKARVLPALFIYSAGMAVTNTVAVVDAIFGKRSEFLRTPKHGIRASSDEWRGKEYNLPFTKTTLLEVFFAVYGVMGMFVAIFSSQPVFVPIIGIQTAGFVYVSAYSIAHSRFKRGAGPRAGRAMASRPYRLALAGIVAIIAIGAVASFEGYRTTVYPLDLARGHLSDISRETSHEQVPSIIAMASGALPGEGNPVWIFPTPETDFGLMQEALEQMRLTAVSLESVDATSAAYHVGLSNIKHSALEIRENLVNATPYMYVSITNIILACVWVAGLLVVFTALKRKKAQIGP